MDDEKCYCLCTLEIPCLGGRVVLCTHSVTGSVLESPAKCSVVAGVGKKNSLLEILENYYYTSRQYLPGKFDFLYSVMTWAVLPEGGCLSLVTIEVSK